MTQACIRLDMLPRLAFPSSPCLPSPPSAEIIRYIATPSVTGSVKCSKGRGSSCKGPEVKGSFADRQEIDFLVERKRGNRGDFSITVGGQTTSGLHKDLRVDCG